MNDQYFIWLYDEIKAMLSVLKGEIGQGMEMIKHIWEHATKYF